MTGGLRRFVASAWAEASILAVAAGLRLWNLGWPHVLIWDEAYYVKDAWTIWQLGYEGTWPGDEVTSPHGIYLVAESDAGFQDGTGLDAYTAEGELVLHPPLGKWLIALGMMAGGGAADSAAWRVTVAVMGILAVLLTMLIARRLTGSRAVALLAGGLMAIDGGAIVTSRVSILDGILTTFVLAGLGCVLLDQRRTQRRFDERLMRDGPPGWGGPVIWRPWLLAAGIVLGLACSVKLSAACYIAFFGLYVVVMDLAARRAAGVPAWHLGGALRQGSVDAAILLPSAFLAYLATFAGWFATNGGFLRNYAEDSGRSLPGVPSIVLNWLELQRLFIVGGGSITAEHSYGSPATDWLGLLRPTTFWFSPNVAKDGWTVDCGQLVCQAQIIDVPNPLIWYAAVLALVWLLLRLALRRDRLAFFLLTAVGAGYLPWFLYLDRTTYAYYAIVFEPYLLIGLAVALVRIGSLDRDRQAPPLTGRRRWQRVTVWGYLGAAVLVSAYFYPTWTGIPGPQWFLASHWWLPTWT